MIEVNKRLYLNEKTIEITDGIIKLRKCLESLYSILIRYWEEMCP